MEDREVTSRNHALSANWRSAPFPMCPKCLRHPHHRHVPHGWRVTLLNRHEWAVQARSVHRRFDIDRRPGIVDHEAIHDRWRRLSWRSRRSAARRP